MAFLRVAEVFQPLFWDRRIDLKRGLDEFVSSVGAIRSFCDLVVVGDMKAPEALKFSSLESAALLERDAGVKAAPVIVCRDHNRPQVRSSILTAYGLGLENLMLVWGDRYPPGAPKNVYDFRGLSEVVKEARDIAAGAGARVRVLAPVDIEALGTAKGMLAAKSRLTAGADFLLAQPPTTDSGRELERHSRLVAEAEVRGSVLLNAFPFRGRQDVANCREFFGWRLPDSLDALAESGEEALLAEARKVASTLKERGFPGVYISTRGTPGVARTLLG